MSVPDWVEFDRIIAVLSVIAAILAWWAKIRWSEEYREAKDAQIQLLESHIATLRDLSSVKIREHYIEDNEVWRVLLGKD